jgi:hypothetical protein
MPAFAELAESEVTVMLPLAEFATYSIPDTDGLDGSSVKYTGV